MLRSILIEGIDCAGKSTLTKELKNHLGWDAKHLVHKNTPSQFERYFLEYATGYHTIFERGHISELVYSHLFGRDLPFTADELRLLDDVVDRTAICILCLPDTQTALARYRERKGVLQIVNPELITKGDVLFAQFKNHYRHTFIYRSQNWEELTELIAAIKHLLTP